ncbi:hypothetical protein [Microbacterium sp. 77mftsu3.1]|uniref:hypothetical protein n=1 Tax=Microbacterium sp. 77mftsu3.1 TaxID=1761802 RepID=UPI000376983E|nr:hypothetical protein [Microbacterium sp. 77mftsu3.1]SDH55729.1 hypothetical protein SAMN04488590_3570 [Microbacterium sp. 77mftsu3.1]
MTTTAEDWLPATLPADLLPLAFATDLIRRWCDDNLPAEGKGACLPASGIVGFTTLQDDIDARLVCGTHDGEPHWWVEAGGFIFDATAGQFGPDRLSVTEASDEHYAATDRYPCGHTSFELLLAEANRSFFDGSDALNFVQETLDLAAEGRRLAAA